ncbi:hypothetical protein A3Q56_04945 [Intoshia linei]|uniref:Protein-tyrosine-phosphatase n=1 Tax=Intoshia linei TaxID=1819745 RepID=A0A177AZ30_9BILA|nr:hypothetical protein A3Q56_04945 [Intoshia linei]
MNIYGKLPIKYNGKNLVDMDYPRATDLYNRYEIIKKIGQGTFGEVFKGVIKKNRTPVALKRLINRKNSGGFPVTSLREIKILKTLNHQGVIALLDIVYSKNGDSLDVYLVFEFGDHDLAGILSNKSVVFSIGEIKHLMMQLTDAIFYIHVKKMIHRDMKTSNILVTNEGKIKIADFGLARSLSREGRYTTKVVTLWYRSPEILFGLNSYDQKVDIWSVGCIIAEMWLRSPFLKGSSEIEQINCIIDMFGSPTEENWPGVTKLPEFDMVKFPKKFTNNFKNFMSKHIHDVDLLHYLSKLLILDPVQRTNSYDAVNDSIYWVDPMPVDPSTTIKNIGQSLFEYTINKPTTENKTFKRPAPTLPKSNKKASAAFTCRKNKFGANCDQECHCLDWNQCHSETGYCLDYQCERGYSSAPRCQDECINQTFGSNCQYLCHCNASANCDIINGLCPNNLCDKGWSGAGCQKQLPKLSNNPKFLQLNCSHIKLAWNAWNKSIDIGDYDIFGYGIYADDDGKSIPGMFSQSMTLENSKCDKEIKIGNITIKNENNNLTINWNYTGPIYANQKFTIQYMFEKNACLSENLSVNNDVIDKSDVAILKISFNENTATIPLNQNHWTKIIGEIMINQVSFNFHKYFYQDPNNWNPHIEAIIKTNKIIIKIKNDCIEDYGYFKFYEYQIFSNDNLFEIETIKKELNEFTIEKLNSFTDYKFTIRIVTEMGKSPFIVRNYKTLKKVADPPTKFKAIEITNTTIFLMWESANTSITYFDINVNNQYNTFEKNYVIKYPTRKIQIDNLGRSTLYLIKIRCINGKITGKYNEFPLIITTKDGIPEPPRQLEIRNFTSDSIAFKWIGPLITTNNVTNYKVLLKEAKFNKNASNEGKLAIVKNVLIKSDHKNEYEMNFNYLKPETNYILIIQSSTNLRVFGKAALLNCFTKPLPPPIPPLLKLLKVTTDIIKVRMFCIKSNEICDTKNLDKYSITMSKSSQIQFRKKKSIHILNLKKRHIDGFQKVYTIESKLSLSNPNSTILDIVLVNYGVVMNSSNKYTRVINLNHLVISANQTYLLRLIAEKTFQNVSVSTFGEVLAIQTDINDLKKKVISESNYSTLIAILVSLIILCILIVILFFIYKYKQLFYRILLKKNNKKIDWTEVYMKDYKTATNNKKVVVVKPRVAEELQEYRYFPNKTFEKSKINIGSIKDTTQVQMASEFNIIEQKLQKQSNVYKKIENEGRNRFKHIGPYDENRVKLNSDISLKEPFNDYINASHINFNTKCTTGEGELLPKKYCDYIVAVSPYSQETVDIFWDMIVSENISKIICMCKSVENDILKCKQYWPSCIGKREYYGSSKSFTVFYNSVSERAYYCLHHLSVLIDYTSINAKKILNGSLGANNGYEVRNVTIYQFIDWPIHGVPKFTFPILDFVNKFNLDLVKSEKSQEIDFNQKFTVLVHCGNGCRSGVFISLHHLINESRIENNISVFETVHRLRSFRPYIVRTLKQYSFIYSCIYDWLLTTNCTFLSKESALQNYKLLNSKMQSSNLTFITNQYLKLKKNSNLNENIKLNDSIISKNRFQKNYIPLQEHCVKIDKPNNYINATFLDGYNKKNEYILTQTPLNNTIHDFWFMIDQYNISRIVLLDGNDFEDTIANFYPLNVGDMFIKTEIQDSNLPNFTLTQTEIFGEKEEYQQIGLDLKNLNNGKISKIKFYKFNQWEKYKEIPNRRVFLNFISRLIDEYKNTVCTSCIICSNGYTRSGMYAIIEKMCLTLDIDKSVNIFQSVRNVCLRSQHFMAYEVNIVPIGQHNPVGHVSLIMRDSCNVSDHNTND